MSTQIRTIALDKLVPHPDNPNRMSRTNFNKLLRHIERTGRYEPLVVRPQPGRPGFFQIINGHHRWAALRKLGYQAAEAVVWNVDDEQTGILLATLNRLNGRDSLDKKLALLRRLHTRLPSRTLARLLPQTYGQIERLLAKRPPAQALRARSGAFAIPLVFFVNESQQQTIEEALATTAPAPEASTRATKRAAALTHLARSFLDRQRAGKAECPETESEVPAAW
jgi:hypothetical protein